MKDSVMTSEAEKAETPPVGGDDRRSFIARFSGWWMGLGLVSGYGYFASMIVRFLYPSSQSENKNKSWQFVAEVNSFKQGDSLTFISPAGDKAVITRMGMKGSEADFIALSSVCPHLGCQVHWESSNNRYFCPCHGGAFDPKGKPTAGPPKAAGQSLPHFTLKVENELLYIKAGTRSLV